MSRADRRYWARFHLSSSGCAAEREAQAVALAQQAMAWDAPVTEVKADGEMLIVAVVERDANGPSVQVYDCTIRRRGRVLP